MPTLPFDRWSTTRYNSWPYRIFKQYDIELMRMRMAHESAKKYTYHHLKTDGAVWDSKAFNYIETAGNNDITIRNWSDVYNDFSNWTRLNQLVALSSYFETYIAAIVKLSIESDPGLIIECPHSVDGIKLIKGGKKLNVVDYETILKGCTKDTWSARLSNLRKLYKHLPQSLTDNVSELEKMRNIRNKMGHAFGRDINASHEYAQLTIEPMEKLSSGAFQKYQTIIRTIVRDLDNLIMTEHVGNFQPLYYYHTVKDTFMNPNDRDRRVNEFKKMIGKKTGELYTRDYCRQIDSYYRNL